MITENLSTLKIHKLTKEQYERELKAGRIDENAIYLTPDEGSGVNYPIQPGVTDILPGTYYTFGEVDSLTINLVDTGDTNKLCEYCFEFIPSSNFTGLTTTPEPKWAHEIRFIPGLTYQASILRGIGVMLCA